MKRLVSKLMTLVFLCVAVNVNAAPGLISQKVETKAVETKEDNKVIITNIKNNNEFSDNTYPLILEQNLQNGSLPTSDNDGRKYKDVGDLIGMQYIRTESRWWNLEISNKFIEFDIDRDATVYIGYVKKLKNIADCLSEEHWLMSEEGGWKYTGKDIIMTNKATDRLKESDQSYALFKKTFKKGHVSLPANGAPGVKVSLGQHYVIVVGPAVDEPLDNIIPAKVIKGKIPAFPGAEGGGMYATGARGGDVYEVTNLEDYGKNEPPIKGSFRDAVSQPNRTVVFRISGNIPLKSTLSISQKNTTIAGQTAPGDGISVRNYPIGVGGTNQIIRFVKSRPGDEVEAEFDSFGVSFGEQIICDHVSAAWSVDEAASFRYIKDFTFQWGIVGESNLHSTHAKGTHGFGGMWGGKNSSLHHNIVLHSVSRMPRFNQGPIDLRNNIFYNWGYKAEYGDYNLANFVGNYYKPGSGTLPEASARFAEPMQVEPWRGFGMYLNGNYMYGSEAVTKNNLLGTAGMDDAKRYIMLTEEVPFPNPVKTQTALAAYETVLKYAGAQRDSVDERYVNEIKTGTGSMIYTRPVTAEKTPDEKARETQLATLARHNAKMVKIQFPDLKSTTPPVDTDHDGMPDDWEKKHGLNPNDAKDRNDDFTGDGYTNLEKYINELAAPFMPPESEYENKLIKFEPVDLSVLKGLSSPEEQLKNPVIVSVNGNPIPVAEKELKATIVDDRVMVPFRAIFSTLNLKVSWDEETKTVIGTKDGMKIELQINNKQAIVNGKAQELDVPAMIIENKTFVPLRFIATSVGAQVVWDGKNKLAMITTKGDE